MYSSIHVGDECTRTKLTFVLKCCFVSSVDTSLLDLLVLVIERLHQNGVTIVYKIIDWDLKLKNLDISPIYGVCQTRILVKSMQRPSLGYNSTSCLVVSIYKPF